MSLISHGSVMSVAAFKQLRAGECCLQPNVLCQGLLDCILCLCFAPSKQLRLFRLLVHEYGP